jgi:hypothetical protein
LSAGGKPTWADAKALGMGFWLQNIEVLVSISTTYFLFCIISFVFQRRQIEAFARNQYMSKDEKDPIACSLFYITLKKKNVLLGLWKLAPNHNEQGAMVKFLGMYFIFSHPCSNQIKKNNTGNPQN